MKMKIHDVPKMGKLGLSPEWWRRQDAVCLLFYLLVVVCCIRKLYWKV